MIAVILAGGKGTRLWPMSREARPKQFFDVVGEKTLLDDTYRRLLRLFPAEKIFVSIGSELRDLVAEHLPDVMTQNIIIEPARRDTGPAMGYVAAMLEQTCPDEPMVFVPSDHYIGDEDRFLRFLEIGGRLVEETGKLVDIGITPTFPNTAMGYTKIGAKLGSYEGVDAYTFAGHTEKPSLAIAELYLKDRAYLWHASYYMWTPARFMQALEKHAPEIGNALREMQTPSGSRVSPLLPKGRGYTDLPKISFDRAVTEKLALEDVIVLRGDFGWSDIGSWDTLYDRLPKGAEENVVKGSVVTINSRGSLVYAPVGKSVAVIGVDDVVVVDTGDALLVCRRSEAQRVKEAVEQMRASGLEKFL